MEGRRRPLYISAVLSVSASKQKWVQRQAAAWPVWGGGLSWGVQMDRVGFLYYLKFLIVWLSLAFTWHVLPSVIFCLYALKTNWVINGFRTDVMSGIL